MIPIMVESVSEAPINAITFDYANIYWAQKLFCTFNLHQYALKRG